MLNNGIEAKLEIFFLRFLIILIPKLLVKRN
jgi:hypothetical protein